MTGLSKIEPLTKEHDLSHFDCGAHESLNLWLRKYALISQASDAARTYVVHQSNQVLAYYTISAGSIQKTDTPLRIAKGLANHPVPVSLLGRLAVDHTAQGIGLGKALLKDALLRIESAADILGIRAVLVHAIDELARDFYLRYDFEPCLDDPLHLMLLMKDLRRNLKP